MPPPPGATPYHHPLRAYRRRTRGWRADRAEIRRRCVETSTFIRTAGTRKLPSAGSGAFGSASSRESEGRGSSSAHWFTRSSGCDVGSTSARSSSATLPTASRMAPSCSRTPLDLLLGNAEPRQLGHVQHVLSRDAHRNPQSRSGKETGPVSGARQRRSNLRSLDDLNVLSLQALVPLLDVELDALALLKRPVAVHRDRGEVDEHVVTLLRAR